MRIRTITVGYGRTHSLPDFCNIKPSVTLTADLEGDDVLDYCLADLEAKCEMHVHRIVDDALEAEGLSPAFSNEPLFRLYRWEQRDDMPVILPDEIKDMGELPGLWRNQGRSPQRYLAIFDYARKRWPDQDLVIIRDEKDLQREVWDWWNARTWYDLWFARAPEDRWTARYAASLAVRTDLDLRGPSRLFEEGSGRNLRCPLQLADLERKLDATAAADLPRHVLASQVEVDEFVAKWVEEHPEPEVPDEDEDEDVDF